MNCRFMSYLMIKVLQQSASENSLEETSVQMCLSLSHPSVCCIIPSVLMFITSTKVTERGKLFEKNKRWSGRVELV